MTAWRILRLWPCTELASKGLFISDEGVRARTRVYLAEDSAMKVLSYQAAICIGAQTPVPGVTAVLTRIGGGN